MPLTPDNWISIGNILAPIGFAGYLYLRKRKDNKVLRSIKDEQDKLLIEHNANSRLLTNIKEQLISDKIKKANEVWAATVELSMLFDVFTLMFKTYDIQSYKLFYRDQFINVYRLTATPEKRSEASGYAIRALMHAFPYIDSQLYHLLKAYINFLDSILSIINSYDLCLAFQKGQITVSADETANQMIEHFKILISMNIQDGYISIDPAMNTGFLHSANEQFKTKIKEYFESVHSG